VTPAFPSEKRHTARPIRPRADCRPDSCDGPCRGARETVVRAPPWPPGTARVAALGPVVHQRSSHTSALTGLSPHVAHERSSGPSLTDGCVVRTAQAVLRPPPTPSLQSVHFPALAGYRTLRSSGRRPLGRGGPPQFPSSPSKRSTPSRPESSSGLRSRLDTPSMAFTLKSGARHSLVHPKAAFVTTRQASRDAADRLVSPPEGALDAALRRRALPPTPAACYRASWQLPGPDSHRQATTSLSLDQLLISTLQHLGTPRRRKTRWRP